MKKEKKQLPIRNKSLYKQCNVWITIAICNLTLYAIGFLLFICSVEYVVLVSTTKDNHFVWNNLNLIWIFGLIMIIIAFLWNIYNTYKTIDFQKKVKYSNNFKIQYWNKYLKKWKSLGDRWNKLFWYFLSLFNIEIFYSSIKKNVQADNKKQLKEENSNPIGTIVQEYYKQLKEKQDNKTNS